MKHCQASFLGIIGVCRIFVHQVNEVLLGTWLCATLHEHHMKKKLFELHFLGIIDETFCASGA